LVRTGNSVFDSVLFCIGGYGITVAVLVLALFVLLILW
jgi:hypothetical protein